MDAAETHRVQTEYGDNGGYWWECSCGLGGSGKDESKADLHSDEHIPENAGRIDTYPAGQKLV